MPDTDSTPLRAAGGTPPAAAERRPARMPGVDMARVVAIALVCLVHVVKAGGVESVAGRSVVGAYETQLLCALGYVSVDLFALVSGYLLARTRSFRAGRFLRLYADVWTVGLLSALVASHVTGVALHAGDWRGIAFPMTRRAYWYFSAYAGMYPFVPLLAAGMASVSRRTLLAATLAALALFSLPVLYDFEDPFVLKRGYSSLWLLALFLAGAHLRLHVPPAKRPWTCLAGVFACAAWTVAFFALERNVPWVDRTFGPKNPFLTYLSPTTVGGAFLLLRYFVSRPWRPDGAAARLAAFLAPAAFGVYLWQTQPFVFRNLFEGSFRRLGALPWPILPWAVLGAALGLFLALALLEKARLRLFDRAARHVAAAWRRRRQAASLPPERGADGGDVVDA